VHRALPGEGQADRAALSAAGLDVAGLEAAGRLRVEEFDFDEPPEASTTTWERGLDDALARGLEALWYSRFAVGSAESEFSGVVAYERKWDETFRGRQVVTLCPYIVGGLDAPASMQRLADVASFHDEVLVPAGGGFERVQAP
jgi:hypothetical protein